MAFGVIAVVVLATIVLQGKPSKGGGLSPETIGETDRKEQLLDERGLGSRLSVDARGRLAEERSETEGKQEVCTIEVLDVASSAFVPLAHVQVFEGGHVQELGIADEVGRLRLADLTRFQGATIWAEAEGFSNHRVVVTGDEENLLRLYLQPEQAIEGTVRLGPSGTPAEGATVIAWEAAERFPPRDAFQRAAAGDPAYHLAVSEGDGHFRIGGLFASRHYSLAAGMLGASVPSPSWGVVPGGKPEELVLQPVYAAKVVLRGEDGGPLESPTHVPVSSAASVGPMDPDVDWQAVPEWMLGLAGIQDDLSAFEDWEGGIAFTSTSAGESLGPFVESVNFDGFDPLKETFFLPRSRTDTLPEIAFTLVSSRQPMGQFSIELRGRPNGDKWFTNREGEAGRVFLDNEDKHLIYTFPRFAEGEVLIGEVPAGDYSVHFASQLRNSYYSSGSPPDLRLRVGGQPAQAVLDISGLSELSLDVRNSFGVGYFGPLVTYVSANGPGLSGNPTFEVSFLKGPYVLSGLTAGEYTIKTRFPRMDETETGAVVQVEKGSDASAQLTVVH